MKEAIENKSQLCMRVLLVHRKPIFSAKNRFLNFIIIPKTPVFKTGSQKLTNLTHNDMGAGFSGSGDSLLSSN